MERKEEARQRRPKIHATGITSANAVNQGFVYNYDAICCTQRTGSLLRGGLPHVTTCATKIEINEHFVNISCSSLLSPRYRNGNVSTELDAEPVRVPQ